MAQTTYTLFEALGRSSHNTVRTKRLTSTRAGTFRMQDVELCVTKVPNGSGFELVVRYGDVKLDGYFHQAQDLLMFTNDWFGVAEGSPVWYDAYGAPLNLEPEYVEYADREREDDNDL